MHVAESMECHPLVLSGGAVLNLASFLLLGRTSALTMNIGGVVKDWVLIGLSVFLFHSIITVINLGGYIIAFIGVFFYNLQVLRERSNAASDEVETASASSEVVPLLRWTSKCKRAKGRPWHSLVLHTPDLRASPGDPRRGGA